MAIHDATYPTRPTTLTEFRWRLLHLFEERVGKRISEQNIAEAAADEAAWAAAKGAL